MHAIGGIILAVVTTFALSLRRPGAAFGLVVCIYALTQWGQSESPLIAGHRNLVYMAAAAVLLTAMILPALRGRAGSGSILTLLVYLLLAWTAVSSIWSPYDDALARLLSAAPVVVFFMLLAPRTIHDLPDLRAAWHTALGIGLPLMVIFIFTAQWADRGLLVAGEWSEQTNPLAIASWSAMLLIIAMTMQFEPHQRFWLIARWPMAIGAVYLIGLSQTRGQLIFAFAAAVLMLLVRGGGGYRRVVSTVLVIAVLYVTASMVLDRIGRPERWQFAALQAAVDDRLQDAGKLLHEWRGGDLRTAIVGLGYSASFDRDIIGFYPHFVPAEALGEMGFIGAGLYTSILVLGVRHWWQLRRAVVDDPVASGLIAALGGIVLFDFLLGLKQGTLLTQTFMLGGMIVIDRLHSAVMNRPRTVTV